MLARHWPAYLSVTGLAVGLSCLVALGLEGRAQERVAPPTVQTLGSDAISPVQDPVDPVEAEARPVGPRLSGSWG